jgi:hypothetical protein
MPCFPCHSNKSNKLNIGIKSVFNHDDDVYDPDVYHSTSLRNRRLSTTSKQPITLNQRDIYNAQGSQISPPYLPIHVTSATPNMPHRPIHLHQTSPEQAKHLLALPQGSRHLRSRSNTDQVESVKSVNISANKSNRHHRSQTIHSQSIHSALAEIEYSLNETEQTPKKRPIRSTKSEQPIQNILPILLLDNKRINSRLGRTSPDDLTRRTRSKTIEHDKSLQQQARKLTDPGQFVPTPNQKQSARYRNTNENKNHEDTSENKNHEDTSENKNHEDISENKNHEDTSENNANEIDNDKLKALTKLDNTPELSKKTTSAKIRKSMAKKKKQIIQTFRMPFSIDALKSSGERVIMPSELEHYYKQAIKSQNGFIISSAELDALNHKDHPTLYIMRALRAPGSTILQIHEFTTLKNINASYYFDLFSRKNKINLYKYDSSIIPSRLICFISMSEILLNIIQKYIPQREQLYRGSIP